MRRVERWAAPSWGLRWWLIGALVVACAAWGSAQGEKSGAPLVTFLEPSEGMTIPSDVDTVTIRFRLISPDNTNLMRYQPFVNGLPGSEPIPIDPPQPQVELTILWRGVKQFPDGVHLITIKVVDAKGREGSGTLTLYKGRDLSKPTAEILQPRSGEVVRGKVPILVRATDDRGLRSLTVSATRRETAKTQTIYMAMGNYGRLLEVTVVWDTTAKHPETNEDLFPDGIYLLQARVQDQERNEGVSSEVLVIVQNRVAQPVISQAPTGQTVRGGALPSTVTEGKTPVISVTPATPEGIAVTPTPVPTPSDVTKVEQAPQIATPSLFRPVPPHAEGAPKTATELSLLPSPQLIAQLATAAIVPQQRLTLALPAVEGEAPKALSTLSPRHQAVAAPQPVGAVTAGKRTVPAIAYVESAPMRVTKQPRPSPSHLAAPQAAASAWMAAPSVGQEHLFVAWVISPRTLQRAPEISEVPTVAVPASVPRLPAPQPIVRRSPQPMTVQRGHSFRYTVIAGDTLFSLAERFGISVKELAAANGLPENAPLRIGQRLLIPARPVTVLVDGKLAECEVPAFLRQNTAVGPFRAVVEAGGGIVGWDHERKQATATLGSFRLTATIGQDALEVNGERVPLSIAPFLLRHRTFLPLRELGTALGKTVLWEKGIVKMESPKR